jgi:hypothetical protein
LHAEENEDLSALLNSLLHSEHGTPVVKRMRSLLSAACSPLPTESTLAATAAFLRAEAME